MSSSPPLGDPIPKVNKFVGESFEQNSAVRTIFAGALEGGVCKCIGPALLVYIFFCLFI